jgi:hypothetical protein
MKLLGIALGFDIAVELLIRYSAFLRYWKKIGSTIRRLYIDFKKGRKYCIVFSMSLEYP